MTPAIACNTYTLRTLGRPAAFRRLQAAEVREVELWSGHAPYDDGDVGARDVRRDAAAAGLRLRAYCIGGLFGLLPAVVEARLERAIAYARALEVDLITLILDPERVPACAAMAERAGVRLALENHWYTAMARPADVRRALAAAGSPAVGAAIDVGHFAFLGHRPRAVARELGACAFHVHVKAVRRGGWIERAVRRARRRHRLPALPPGPHDRLEELVAGLVAAGYTGALAIEDEGAGDDAARVARWRDRLRDVLAATGPAAAAAPVRSPAWGRSHA